MPSIGKVVSLPGAAPSPVKQPRATGDDKRRKTDRPPNTMADGRKRFRLKVGDTPDGKPIMKNFTGRTRAEALEKQRQYERDAESGVLARPKINPVLDPAQPVGRWADRWYLIYYKGSERGEMTTKSIIKKIRESDFGKMSIGDVVQLDVQKFANGNVHSFSYVTKIRDVVIKMFEAAVANKILDSSPCVGVRWENKGAGERRPLHPWEIELVTNHWDEHPAGVGAMLMLYTGARPEEARALNWDNITDESVLIRDSSYFDRSGQMALKLGVTKTKAGQRDIPIAGQLRDMLERIGRMDGELVWKSASGERLTGIAYQRNWDSFIFALRCIRVGVKKNKIGTYSGFRVDKLSKDDKKIWDSTMDVTPYSMRHTYCTILYDADVDVKTMQYLMGHNDLETTLKIYAALTEAKKTRSYDKLDAYFVELSKGDDGA